MSASESWTDQKPSGLYETRGEVGQQWNDEEYDLPFVDDKDDQLKSDDKIDVDYNLND